MRGRREPLGPSCASSAPAAGRSTRTGGGTCGVSSSSTNRAFEQDFPSKVTAMRTYANDCYVVSGNRAFVVWRLDIDHAEWGTMSMTQVAIQEWKDGRIVHEKFVYW